MNTSSSQSSPQTQTASAELIDISIDGRRVQVPSGISVAAALAWPGSPTHGVARQAVDGAPRAPFCGMGVCQECRTLIDGRRRLSCQTTCRDGMRIETDAAVAAQGTTADEVPA